MTWYLRVGSEILVGVSTGVLASRDVMCTVGTDVSLYNSGYVHNRIRTAGKTHTLLFYVWSRSICMWVCRLFEWTGTCVNSSTGPVSQYYVTAIVDYLYVYVAILVTFR